MLIGARLQTLLCSLCGSGATHDHRRLFEVFDVPPPEVLPWNASRTADFVADLVGVFDRRRGDLHDLYLKLMRAYSAHEERIQGVLLPLLAEEAFSSDKLPVPVGLVEIPQEQLITMVKGFARPGSSLMRWLELYCPGVTPQTPELPSVLRVTVKNEYLQEVALIRRGVRWIPLADSMADASVPPGSATPPIGPQRFEGSADLLRALHDIVVHLNIERPDQLVLLVEAPAAFLQHRLHAQRFSGSRKKLDSWFKAVAWWPQREGGPVFGAVYDADLPKPDAHGVVGQWDTPPTDEQEAAATLGVWAGPQVWTASCDCAVVGYHDTRYFAVLCEGEPVQGGAMSLDSLFNAVRGKGLLIWTDRRFIRRYTGPQQ